MFSPTPRSSQVKEGQDAPKTTPAEQIALAATAAETFLRSSNHNQKALEDMLINCYRAFPFSSKVEIASVMKQTFAVEKLFLECMLEGGKYKKGQLHASIRKILHLLREQYEPEKITI